MSSHAAAAISAMITSQVYPQMWRPAPRPARRTHNRSRQPKARALFSKGNTKAIGSIQVLIGVGVLATFFFASLYHHDSPTGFITISVILSIVCIISGLVSAFARGNKLITAAVVTNSLSAVTAVAGIVVYSCSFYFICSLCSGIPLFLSSLNLLITVLSIVYGCKVLRHTDTQEPSRQEGWRDGLSRWEDEKMLNTIIVGQQPKTPATHQP